MSEQLFNLDLWTSLMDLLPLVLTVQTTFFMIDLTIYLVKLVKRLGGRKGAGVCVAGGRIIL